MRIKVRSEQGETYVELLMTIVIIGIVGTALIGAILTSITSSTVHRNLANDDGLVKSALEQAKYDIQIAPRSTSPSLPIFADCGNGVTASTLLGNWNGEMTSNSLWPEVPSGIGNPQAWISGVECFMETSALSGPDSTCSASEARPGGPVVSTTGGCTSSSDYSGIIEVTVSVVDQSGLVTSLTTLVRNPAYNADYPTSSF